MRFFISAGEPSGDLHGSNLIRELRQRLPQAVFTGFGCHKMSETGCQLVHDMSDLAIMGFARVVPHVRTFWQLLQQADEAFTTHRPDAVILIDYPGFNWWVARKAKRHGIPVFYYGTPQIWAWATHRVKKLRRLVDHALCKLPFEPEWYEQHDCRATFVGHPYFDEFANRELDVAFLNGLSNDPLVAVLPGSRKHEVEHNLPAFLKTIDFVAPSAPNTQFAIASYNAEQADMARRIVAAHNGVAEPTIVVNRTRELIHRADCALACSGSVSLELLHELTPTVVHYKIDHLHDFLQRKFRRCKFITLVNLLTSERRFCPDDDYDANDVRNLNEAPFPEYLTVEDRSAEMAHHLLRWLLDAKSHAATIQRLRPLRDTFAQPGASQRAAAYIADQLSATGNPHPSLSARAKVA